MNNAKAQKLQSSRLFLRSLMLRKLLSILLVRRQCYTLQEVGPRAHSDAGGDTCEHCSERDTLSHRVLRCPAFSTVRDARPVLSSLSEIDALLP